MHRKVIRYTLIFLIFSVRISAQEKAKNMPEVKKMLSGIKSISSIGYQYELSVEYPNGQTDHIKGEMAIDNDRRLMYNSCDAFTLIYSEDFFYRADHRKKTVSIVKLKRNNDKHVKDEISKEIFSNDVVSNFLDSIVMTYATVKKIQTDNDTIKLEMIFPEELPLKSLNIFFDQKHNIPVTYNIRTFQPWKSNEFGKKKGTTQIVICRDFKRINDDAKYGTDHFFLLNNGSVSLKKYNNYTLNTKL